MKFIFPKNYQFKNKLLGIIDYPTAFLNVFWCVFIFILVNLFFNSINLKVIFFISLCFPLILFSFSGFHGDNIVYVIQYLFMFLFRQKLYFFGRDISKFKNSLGK